MAEGLADTLGRPLQDLRISLLDRCNLRCPYCMPAAEYTEDYQFLSRAERLSHDEIFRVAWRAVAGQERRQPRIATGDAARG